MLEPAFVLGVMKGGTSALCDGLVGHRQILRGRALDNEPAFYSKELHFFNHESRHAQGAEFFFRHFAHAHAVLPPANNSSSNNNSNSNNRNLTLSTGLAPDNPRFALDCTPNYFTGPALVANRIKETFGHLPRLRMAIVLRDPVLRTVSHFRHAVALGWLELKRNNPDHWAARLAALANGNIDATIASCLQQHQDCVRRRNATTWVDIVGQCHICSSLLSLGLYDTAWRHWEAVFRASQPSVQFCFISNTALRNDAAAVVSRVAQFFGTTVADEVGITRAVARSQGRHSRSHVVARGNQKLEPSIDAIEQLSNFYYNSGRALFDKVEAAGGVLGC